MVVMSPWACQLALVPVLARALALVPVLSLALVLVLSRALALVLENTAKWTES